MYECQRSLIGVGVGIVIEHLGCSRDDKGFFFADRYAGMTCEHELSRILFRDE